MRIKGPGELLMRIKGPGWTVNAVLRGRGGLLMRIKGAAVDLQL